MSRPILILGSSGLAREVATVITAINRQNPSWEIVGFVSDDPDEIGRSLGPGAVVGNDAWVMQQDRSFDIAVGIGIPRVRSRLAAAYLQHGDRFSFPNLIHPKAVYDPATVEIGQGNVVTAGSVFTCDIGVGDFNYFNLNVTVGHDATIGSFNVINPGCNLSGNVSFGDEILMGTGAQVLETLSVGSGATIGAGAVVVGDVGSGSTVVGIPAKPIQR